MSAEFKNLGEFNDNLSIEEYCKSSEYLKQINVLDTILKISSQRPIHCLDESKPEKPYNCRIGREPPSSDPPRSLGKFKVFQLIWRSKTIRYLNLIYYIYFATKMVLICFFHLQFYRAQSSLILRGGEVRTEICRVPNHLDKVVLRTQKQIENIQEWLEWLGDPWMSCVGGTTINYLIPIWNYLIFYWVVLASCESNRWSIDQVGFLMNPVAVRSTIQRQLDYLATKLIKTITFYRISCRNNGSAFNIEKKGKNEKGGSKVNTTKDDYGTANTEAKGISTRVQIIIQRLDLMQQFLRTDYWNLVNPIVYSVHWLKKIGLVSYAMLTWFGTIGMVFWISGICFWQLSEYHKQAKTRLDWFECQSWSPLAVPIHSFVPPEELSGAEKEAYKDCDGSILSLILHGILIERKHFLSYRKILTLFEIGMGWPGVVFCSLLCVSEFGLGILDKVRWLDQIRAQISVCYDKCMIKNIDQDEKAQKQLLQLSMAAYLNYSLFMTHFEPFRRTANMFMMQILSQTIPVLICVYYLSTNYGRVTNIAWNTILIMYAAVLVNIFLICYSLVVRKARQVSKQILKLTTASSKNNFQSEYIRIFLNLWRRQILDDSQLVNIYGLKFFGIGLTLSKIVSFNIYLLGLTFIVLRRSDSS